MYSYDVDDLQGLLDHIGIKTKTSGDEIQFERCPVCGSSKQDKYTSSINRATGLFHCHRGSCRAPDLNFAQLAREVEYVIPSVGTVKYYRYRQPAENERDTRAEAVEYLKSRGISETIARRYYCTTMRKNPKVLVFPFYDENNELQFIKYRNMDKKPEGYEGDWHKEWADKPQGMDEEHYRTKKILFGMKQCDPKADSRLIITEGQIDSLSVAEAGYINAVSVPNGKSGWTWLPNCKDWIEKNFRTLIVFGDNERGEMSLLDRLQSEMDMEVKAVRLPDYLGCKDANEILQDHGAEAIRYCIENAEPAPVPGVLSIAKVIKPDKASLMCKTGFGALDRTMHGFQTGRLYVVTGKRASGKSTFISQCVTEIVKNPKVRVLVYSGELNNSNFKDWLYRQSSASEDIRKVQLDDDLGEEYVVDDAKVRELDKYYKNKVYLIDDAIDADPDVNLLDKFAAAVKRYRANFLVVDNLASLVARESADDDSRNARQSAITAALAGIAHKLDVGVFLIAHPRKNISGDALDNISGSSDIANFADMSIMVTREMSGKGVDGTIELIKNRINGKLLLAERKKSGELTDNGNEIRYLFKEDTMHFVVSEDVSLGNLRARAEEAKAASETYNRGFENFQ